MKITGKKLHAKELPEPNLPAMKTYKQTPGNLNNAVFAAHATAKKMKSDIVIVAGNSKGHFVYHLAMPKDDLKKYQPGQTKKSEVVIVTPKGAVYNALAESDLVDKYLQEKKKKKTVVDKGKSDQKKALRIPTAPKSFTFKDKKKYNRKEKHKSQY